MKVFNKIITLALIFMTAACSPVVKSGHIQRAVEACKNHEGISQVNFPTFFAAIDLNKIYSVECNDGTVINIGRNYYRSRED